ncbi:hypothetical protein BKA61DRAFT_60294 [Leptodontidium sp. MPI-SDFR-AT-0119]|nr:hypothetical protein BKA61DRAFT_60294 [Leptodontidium sp. MPI-SDFR-AT-0119]
MSATTLKCALLLSAFATTASSPVRYSLTQRIVCLDDSDKITIGHESNGCPLPRTTEAKQCYHCQGLGHVQADCPTLRLSGAGTSGRCYNCGQPGHLARSCPSPAGPGPIPGAGRGLGGPRGGFGGGFAPRGGFAGGPRPATCYKCGGPNHFARDCMFPKTISWSGN